MAVRIQDFSVAVSIQEFSVAVRIQEFSVAVRIQEFSVAVRQHIIVYPDGGSQHLNVLLLAYCILIFCRLPVC